MTTRPEPYLRRNPGDVIRSGDWNELQILAREETLSHRHTGGPDGLKIPRAGIEPGAVDGSLIDPTAEAALKKLTLEELLIRGKLTLGDIADLHDEFRRLESEKVNRAGDVISGPLEVNGDLTVGVSLMVGVSLTVDDSLTVNGSQMVGDSLSVNNNLEVKGTITPHGRILPAYESEWRPIDGVAGKEHIFQHKLGALPSFVQVFAKSDHRSDGPNLSHRDDVRMLCFNNDSYTGGDNYRAGVFCRSLTTSQIVIVRNNHFWHGRNPHEYFNSGYMKVIMWR